MLRRIVLPLLAAASPVIAQSSSSTNAPSSTQSFIDTPTQTAEPAINKSLLYYNGDRDPLAPETIFADLSDNRPHFVFSMSTIYENGDILIHMQAPGSVSWFGAGFGTTMEDSFMIVSYPTANGTHITTSPRMGTGQVEPAHFPQADVHLIWGDTYGPNSNLHSAKGVSIAHVLCSGCTRFIKNFDYNNTKLPCFYAVGQNGDIFSDELDAPLTKHTYHGLFTLDMTKATSYRANYGRVPAPNGDTVGAIFQGTTFYTQFGQGPFEVTYDSDYWPVIHAVFMLVAFVFVFPLGALAMRIIQSTLIHMVSQTVGLVFVVIGFVGAYFVSVEFIRTRNYDSAHQRLGFVIFGLIFLQATAGTLHHLIFKAHKRKVSRAPSIDDPMHPKGPKPIPLNKIHAFLGPAVMVLALVNGGLGFNLAQNSSMIIPYGVVVGVLFAVYIGIRIWAGSFAWVRAYEPDAEMLAAYMKDPVYNQYNASSDKQPSTSTREVHSSDEHIPMTPAPYTRNPAPYTPLTTQRPRAPWERADSFTTESPYSAASYKAPWSALHDGPQTHYPSANTHRHSSITEEEEETREDLRLQTTNLHHYASTEQMLPSIQERRQETSPVSAKPRPSLQLKSHARM